MLNLDTETICDLLDKARQFQVKEEVSFPEVTEEMDANYVLADYQNDPVYQEVIEYIDNLRPDQQATLVALMYLGRGDYAQDEWEDALTFALEEVTEHTGEYLLSRPTVADDIGRGLNMLGLSCEE
ncbi:DUF3775 domain-containing protein [Fluoribacter dumoffii]|uniref:Protein of uncharacterized function (DUF3775) n=1 Tax=Fluoribacter dumoffii TaxID=463 RepID=A0A377GBW5_9GAMM|nr:DUF3775 domain-containing protein [Fluoribacter dumoffii]KTC90612.1 hypothetical protein Ldum_1680 [Fluoribacter dumoffii NY 23]MCW8386291.1 DUF3775 domain-containing protein [Fluoribacter dumoffii]MCW8419344.1 DUF3775 domain-containing protein [Fluoribacter dumoffii]MCW8452781.1 DUF3775 domain-containing protein [Fluoribacter dumoffii]MCW8459969.1 DUF3775 domain-containing protein [Fluoribacter dumoffii]